MQNRIITRQGLTGVLKSYYPKPLLYGMILFTVPAIVLNIGEDIQAMGAVTNMLFPEVSKRKNTIVVDKKLIVDMWQDVDFGMFLTFLVFYFIILTTGTVIFDGGMHDINTVQDAAMALRPIADDGAYWLCALGVIGTGMLAIPVLAGAVSYILAETFNWEGA